MRKTAQETSKRILLADINSQTYAYLGSMADGVMAQFTDQ